MNRAESNRRVEASGLARLVVGAVAYLLVAFPLAYVWHLVAFEATYARLGYITRDPPIVAFGFLAILLQGTLLSLVSPRLAVGDSPVSAVVGFAAVMGGYHWSTHVLAEAAKHPLEPLGLWFALETTFLVLQFTLGAAALAAVHRRGRGPAVGA